MTAAFSKLWHHFSSDALFRNSVYLMMTTGVMGVLGFVFWSICTHLFSPDEIGLGTTMISAMSLLSLVSLLGFNTTFIRYLPTSPHKNDDINTGSLLVILLSIVLSIGYVVCIPYASPQLGIIHENIWYAVGFVVMTVLASLNSLTDSIFIAYRSAQYSLLTNGFVVSIAKLFLPFLFVGMGAYGVFTASGLATSFGMMASIVCMVFIFDFRPQFKISIPALQRVFHYSFTNYLANLISMFPTLVLPIIIINHLGAPAAAYYFLAYMLMNLLYAVSNSIAQSLLAEGSHDGNVLRHLLKRASILIVTIMTPAALVAAIFGPYVLQLFGKSYSAGGASVVTILALAAPAVAAYHLGSALLRIRHQLYALMINGIVYAITICGLALLWVDRGIGWVALAWALGNCAAAAIAFVSLYMYRGAPTPVQVTAEA